MSHRICWSGKGRGCFSQSQVEVWKVLWALDQNDHLLKGIDSIRLKAAQLLTSQNYSYQEKFWFTADLDSPKVSLDSKLFKQKSCGNGVVTVSGAAAVHIMLTLSLGISVLNIRDC